jgi:hypothetical protein
MPTRPPSLLLFAISTVCVAQGIGEELPGQYNQIRVTANRADTGVRSRPGYWRTSE